MMNGFADLKTKAKVDTLFPDTFIPGGYYKRCLREDVKQGKVNLESWDDILLVVFFQFQQKNHFSLLNLLGNTFSKAMRSFKIPPLNAVKVLETQPRNNWLVYLNGKRSSLGSHPGLAVRLIG